MLADIAHAGNVGPCQRFAAGSYHGLGNLLFMVRVAPLGHPPDISARGEGAFCRAGLQLAESAEQLGTVEGPLGLGFFATNGFDYARLSHGQRKPDIAG